MPDLNLARIKAHKIIFQKSLHALGAKQCVAILCELIISTRKDTHTASPKSPLLREMQPERAWAEALLLMLEARDMEDV